jgi:TonB family protein
MGTEEKPNLISPSVIEGKAISKPQPEYPWFALTFEISGDVAVEVVIDESGNVTAAKPVSGPLLLRQAAVDAAYKARFTPTLLSGQPVKVKGLIAYRFRLESK